MGYSKADLVKMMGKERAEALLKSSGVSAPDKEKPTDRWQAQRQIKAAADAKVNNPDHPQNKLLHMVRVACEKTTLTVESDYLAIPGRRTRVDVAIPKLHLAFELDGYSHHGLSKAGFQNDRSRDRLLIFNDWRVLRFTAKEVNYNYSETFFEIQRIIEKFLSTIV